MFQTLFSGSRLNNTIVNTIVNTIGNNVKHSLPVSLISHYSYWLHTQWPAGTVEPSPEQGEGGQTAVDGLYLIGDLTGVPLLKFALDSGAKVSHLIAQRIGAKSNISAAEIGGGADGSKSHPYDVVIVGGGVAGMAAAIEAKRKGLDFVVLESARPFSTLENFPLGKPIFTYPKEMTPSGELQVTGENREALLAELHDQVLMHKIIPRIATVQSVDRQGGLFATMMEGREPLHSRYAVIAIGRSGEFRRLGVTGETLAKVHNRVFDPRAYDDQSVLVVGGGDSALEAAIAIAKHGGEVTLSYRKESFTRPKSDNIDAVMMLAGESKIALRMASKVISITDNEVVLRHSDGGEERLKNDAVLVLIGRKPPLDLLRRSGVKILGDWGKKRLAQMSLFLLLASFVYLWKGGTWLNTYFKSNHLFPFNIPEWLIGLGGRTAFMAKDSSTVLGTLSITLAEPGFYYSALYSVVMVVFGIARIRRRKTPYVTWQTISLLSFQLLPLFFLPYFLLPYLGHNGAFESGMGKAFADQFFPLADYAGHGREYWRAFGFVLAWPLFIWNFFTSEPMYGWLVVGFIQTFILIPLLVWRWGKGAYCGWICSCGGMAETLGDTHRQKMPHGPIANRLNMIGQGVLAIVTLLAVMRVALWTLPYGALRAAINTIYGGLLYDWGPLSYYGIVDIFLAGIVGMGLYFWFSGRVWCRFACPLAALMHIYARFSRFRIIPDKKKCISCGVCTQVCHQGIDVMAFASQGESMADPECVRCSACVQSCPTGTLQFGQVNTQNGALISFDSLAASALHAKSVSLTGASQC